MAALEPQSDWVFDEPKNVAVITTRQIIRDGHPILYVSHDADDGAWQFHTGGAFATQDGMIVALHSIVELDPSVSQLADLPLGWVAQRANATAAWERSLLDD